MFGGNSFPKKSFEEPLKFDCRIPQYLSLCMFTYYAVIKTFNNFKHKRKTYHMFSIIVTYIWGKHLKCIFFILLSTQFDIGYILHLIFNQIYIPFQYPAYVAVQFDIGYMSIQVYSNIYSPPSIQPMLRCNSI